MLSLERMCFVLIFLATSHLCNMAAWLAQWQDLCLPGTSSQVQTSAYPSVEHLGDLLSTKVDSAFHRYQVDKIMELTD